MIIGATAILATLAAGIFLMLPQVAGRVRWRAIATPLASIIGSGFLVTVPILREMAGAWAIMPMAGLLVLAYLIGGAIRHNIRHVEPIFEDGSAPLGLSSLERLSHLVLAFAYFVSVTYYLVLFASFGLKPFGIVDETAVKIVVTICLALIAGVGFTRGFSAVERVEVYTVSLKLAIIAGLIAGLAVYGLGELATGTITTIPGHLETKNVPVFLGLLIVVQGFETSRFLGNAYDTQMRISTMKQAQILAGIIYLAFFFAMIPLLAIDVTGAGIAAIVDMLKPVSIVLPALIMIGALASQSSAAIADTLGAGGLLHDITGGRVRVNYAYPLIAVIAALITWETNIYSLITLASRCFAFFYALQCLIASLSAIRRHEIRGAVLYALLGVVCAAVVAFGAPVEGE
ncbi:hypothetical protein [Breoghania sp.]|uniref:hypothetical protein n=1 Tax=Breoghania sp. TaxID=2065378 RepID=UPI0029CA3B40|nr:hypothetical protein [Breoghania sp.]